MARPRRDLDIQGEGDEVRSLYKTEKEAWRRERLLAVKLGLEGKLSLADIAEQLGRARSVIQNWFNAYREGGIEKLLSRKSGIAGRKPTAKITKQISEQIVSKLEAGEWRTAKEAEKWLKDEHGVVLAKGSIYYVLGKHEGRLKVVRPVHRKKDHERAEQFKTGLCSKLMELQIPDDKNVRFWVQDEMRYGLQTVVRSAWGLKGVRIVKQAQQKYQWGYTYGALEVGGQNAAEFSYLPTVSKEATRLHLEQISRSDPASVHVLIWDGAGFHQQDQEEGVPENIRLIRLPPYSPELNPIEKLWDITKDMICNRIFDTLDDLEEKITESLERYWEDGELVKSLIGDGWMLGEINAT